MTDQEIIEVLAKREGLYISSCGKYQHIECYGWMQLPPYLDSIDALKPVLMKLTDSEWLKLLGRIWELHNPDMEREGTFTRFVLTIDPAILARAVAETIKEGETK